MSITMARAAARKYRAGLLGRINGSTLRLGDNLDVRLQFSTGGRLAYGRVGYELPVGGQGRDSACRSRRGVRTRPGLPPRSTPAVETDLVRSGSPTRFVRARAPLNLFGRLGWREKRLNDRLDAVGFSGTRSFHTGA